MEAWLVKLLFVHEDLIEWAAAHLEPRWIEHGLARQAATLRLEAHQNQSWSTLAGFLAGCGSPEVQALITEATAEERPMPNPAQQLRDVVQRLRSQFIARQMASLLNQLNQPGLSEPQRLALLRQQQDLRSLKSRPIESRQN
jgi:hypothetical protein